MMSCFGLCTNCQQQSNQNIAQERTIIEQASFNESTELIKLSDFPLVHIVFLDLKDDITIEELSLIFKQIESLNKIEEVNNLRIGSFENMKDARAMSNLELAFDMEFENKRTYKIYQNHQIHLDLKKNLGPMLNGPPVTYDFYKK